MVAIIRERLSEDDTAADSFSTAFRARSLRPRRSTRCWRSSTRHLVCPRVPARPRRRVRAAGRPGRGRAAQPTTSPRRSGTGMQVYAEQAEQLIAYYLAKRHLVGIDAAGAWPRCMRRSRTCSSTRSARLIDPQIQARDREDGQCRPRRGRGARAPGRDRRARHHDRRARSDRREAYPRAGWHADVQGIPRLSRPRSAHRRTRWSCTGSPALPPRGGRPDLVDVGVTLDGFVADSAYTFAVGEIDAGCAAPDRRLPRSLDAGVSRSACRQPDRGHLAAVQRTRSPPASRSSGRSSATAWGVRCTRSPRSQLRRARATGWSWLPA